MANIKAFAAIIAISAVPNFAIAQTSAHNASPHDHGGAIFHAINFEASAGQNDGETIYDWDLDGWIGGDNKKLWLKSEGEISNRKAETAEIIALYSANISTFWDAQIGIRYDFESPKDKTFAAIGISGLAPYFFETEAHIFVAPKSGLNLRLRQENEILITNRLITSPYFEVDLGKNIGDEAKIGLQTRYEFSRRFAPFFNIEYAENIGREVKNPPQNNHKPSATNVNLGIKFLF